MPFLVLIAEFDFTILPYNSNKINWCLASQFLSACTIENKPMNIMLYWSVACARDFI
jgi:hypothetical protein